MVCEDGWGAQHVFGVTRRGEVYPMARNRQNLGTDDAPDWGEFAGVTFSRTAGRCTSTSTTRARRSP